jgi:hypothetical protein
MPKSNQTWEKGQTVHLPERMPSARFRQLIAVSATVLSKLKWNHSACASWLTGRRSIPEYKKHFLCQKMDA